MNILVTLDSGYIDVLCVMLKSLLMADKDTFFTVYVMNSSLTQKDFDKVRDSLPSHRLKLVDIKAKENMLAGAPVTDRYPQEMYYRIFAAKFLPETVDRVLYLDPDLIVRKPLTQLYNTDMGDNYFAAASHVGRILTKANSIRLQSEEPGPYINSGVMLINTALLRKEQDFRRVYEYIEKRKAVLLLPDQDVISGLYSHRILCIDPFVYNMSERLLLHPSAIEKGVTPGWVADNSAIVHYCGRNKPWKERYTGLLGYMYHRVAAADVPE